MKKSKIQINIGGASIILLLAVLALTIFAVLSIRASYNELQMSKRMRDSVQTYYLTDKTASETYHKFYQAWKAAEKPARQDAELLWRNAGVTTKVDNIVFASGKISFELAVDYNRTLLVGFQCDEDNCSITCWRVKSMEYGDYEGEILDIWDGTF